MSNRKMPPTTEMICRFLSVGIAIFSSCATLAAAVCIIGQEHLQNRSSPGRGGVCPVVTPVTSGMRKE